MRKFKFFIDFDKEEKWLEEMAKEGYQLKGTFLGYKFEKGEPEETTIRIDFRKFKKKEDFDDYKALFEDSGWEHLVGSKSSGIQYFKKVREDADDDIFSDTDSKAARYKRYANMCFESALSYLPFLMVFYLTNIINFRAFVNPKELYFTPGLWEKTGASFWAAFLFETPFALIRGLAWAIIPVTILLYLFFGIQSKRLYMQKSNS